MLKSMTAYGRASTKTPLGLFTVEIQSVNRKHLEIFTTLPQELSLFDQDIRSQINAQIKRGQVTVKVFVAFETSPVNAEANIPLAKQIKTAWDAILNELNIKDPANTSFLQYLTRTENIVTFTEDLKNQETFKNAIHESVENALLPFIEMRKKEGSFILQDFQKRLQSLRHSLSAIEKLSEGITKKYYDRLTSKLKELFTGSPEQEERLLREVALYADKVDVSEEITRFKSHLNQFEEVIKRETEVGKTIEFILQEMMREANTLGTKSPDAEATRIAVEMKAEIERIREQIQNIE